MVQLLRDVLWDVSFGPSDVIPLSQSDCAKSLYRSLENPNKHYNVFEGFSQFCRKRGITIYRERSSCRWQSFEENDTHNAVHPESWSGDDNDNFLNGHLRPGLDNLLKSNEAVLVSIKANPLLACQSPTDKLSREGFQILKGVIER